MPGSFLDTNVIVYIASSDAGKADRAEAIIAKGGSISVQVLNELANVARRKLQLSCTQTRRVLKTVRDLLDVHPITVATHDAGLALAERYGLSIYDAMIAASALDAGCDTLWSEDMHDGLPVAGRLQVTNPFRS